MKYQIYTIQRIPVQFHSIVSLWISITEKSASFDVHERKEKKRGDFVSDLKCKEQSTSNTCVGSQHILFKLNSPSFPHQNSTVPEAINFLLMARICIWNWNLMRSPTEATWIWIYTEIVVASFVGICWRERSHSNKRRMNERNMFRNLSSIGVYIERCWVNTSVSARGTKSWKLINWWWINSVCVWNCFTHSHVISLLFWTNTMYSILWNIIIIIMQRIRMGRP